MDCRDSALFSGVDEAARAAFFDTAARMNDNLDAYLKEER